LRHARGAPETWETSLLLGPQDTETTDIGGPLLHDTRLRSDYSRLTDSSQALSRACYFGPFRNALTQTGPEHFDIPIGTAFVGAWHNWQTGNNTDHNLAISQVIEDIRGLFSFQRLEITAATGTQTLHVSIDGRPYKLKDLGSGLAEIIVTLATAAIKTPTYILVDEPELHLHPSLQASFLTRLATYATRGVMFATHSMGLARTVSDEVYCFRRRGDAVSVASLTALDDYGQFLGEMSFSSWREVGAEHILLVEGPSDVRAIQCLLRLYKKDGKIVVLPLGGDMLAGGKNVDALGEFMRLGIPVSALVDSERAGPSDPPSTARAMFGVACKRLGITVQWTERRALENYFPDYAVKSGVGTEHSAIGPFDRLSDSARAWSKRDNWRIATEMSIADLAGSDLGRVLEAL